MFEYKMDLDPTTNARLIIKLFRNVRNTQFLRKQIMTGTLKCCFVKPLLISDPFTLTIAANKALTAEKITTKSIFTEILYNLSISKNISQSLISFGIHDDDTDLLVLVIGDENRNVFDVIEGDETDINVLKELADIKAIQKTYKLKDTEATNDLLSAVCNKIVIKDFA